MSNHSCNIDSLALAISLLGQYALKQTCATLEAFDCDVTWWRIHKRKRRGAKNQMTETLLTFFLFFKSTIVIILLESVPRETLHVEEAKIDQVTSTYK